MMFYFTVTTLNDDKLVIRSLLIMMTKIFLTTYMIKDLSPLLVAY